MSTEAALSYRPDHPCYGVTFARATTARYVDNAPDFALAYWPGQLFLTEAFARATTARFVNETRYPADG